MCDICHTNWDSLVPCLAGFSVCEHSYCTIANGVDNRVAFFFCFQIKTTDGALRKTATTDREKVVADKKNGPKPDWSIEGDEAPRNDLFISVHTILVVAARNVN